MLPTFYQLRTASLMNPNSFNSLPEELQGVLLEASASADKIGADWAKQKRDQEHAEMTAAGVEFISLPEDQAERFTMLTEEKLWEDIAAAAPQDAARLSPLFDNA